METPDAPSPHMSERLASAPAYSVVVIGASAGGIPALIKLLSALPAAFLLPILLVQHLPAGLPSNLPAILGWRTKLRVKWAEHGEVMTPSTVFIAPPDRHLLVTADHRLALSSGERVGLWRPAVDALFLSAAAAYGARAAAIVLSGAMWDGAKGIDAVARQGGITIVQDEASASYFDMPAAALDIGHADVMMNPQKIAVALELLAEQMI